MSMLLLIWRSRLIQGHWRCCEFHTSVLAFFFFWSYKEGETRLPVEKPISSTWWPQSFLYADTGAQTPILVGRCYPQRQLDISVCFTLPAFSIFQPYMNYLEKQDDLLVELDKAQKNHKEFECIYKDFEAQKVCYLPLNTFLLKPGQRLLHYKLLLESKSCVY